MRFKLGQMVKVKSYEEIMSIINTPFSIQTNEFFIYNMKKFCGNIYKITEIFSDDNTIVLNNGLKEFVAGEEVSYWFVEFWLDDATEFYKERLEDFIS